MLYACTLKSSTILWSFLSSKPNLFLAVLCKVVEMSNDPECNEWFKLGYCALLSRLEKSLPFKFVAHANSPILKDLKFAYSLESPETNQAMLAIMRKFQFTKTDVAQ